MDIPLPPSPPGPNKRTSDEYSPSHVTSPMTDDDDDDKFMPPRFSESSPATPKSGSKDSKPKLLGASRATKLLHSFKVSKSGGPISMDLGKSARPKFSKLKNFDDDEADQVRYFEINVLPAGNRPVAAFILMTKKLSRFHGFQLMQLIEFKVVRSQV